MFMLPSNGVGTCSRTARQNMHSSGTVADLSDCEDTDASATTKVTCMCGVSEIDPHEVCNHDYSPNEKLRRCAGNGVVEGGKYAAVRQMEQNVRLQVEQRWQRHKAIHVSTGRL